MGAYSFSRDTWRRELIGLSSGESKDIMYRGSTTHTHQTSRPIAEVLLFTEGGEGGGPNYSVYQRGVDEASGIRLGGWPCHQRVTGWQMGDC